MNTPCFRHFACVVSTGPSSRQASPVTRLIAAGFTLTELLTVIAIIGILAAIIIPVVGNVRASAQKSQCMSNLREWGNAVHLFSQDFKGLVVANNDLGLGTKIYSPYFGQEVMRLVTGDVKSSQEAMSHCPTAPSDSGDPHYLRRCYGFGRPNDTPWNTYSLKSFSPNYDEGKADKNVTAYMSNQVARPSTLLLMIEMAPGTDGQTVDRGSQLESKVRPIQIDDSKMRHGGVVNALFFDGHVDVLTANQTDYSDQTNKAQIDRWFKLN